MDRKLTELYLKKHQKHQVELDKLKKKRNKLAILRGLVFLGLFVTIYLFRNHGFGYILLASLGFVIPFLLLIRINVKINDKIAIENELIAINLNEISAQNGDHSVFYPGNEFIDSNHPYSFDLDVFGEGSIFQLINRCVTHGGVKKLAETLNAAKFSITRIKERQEAIHELSELLDLRQNFMAFGKIELQSGIITEGHTRRNYHNESKFHKEMIDWLAAPAHFIDSKLLIISLFVFPIASVLLFIMVLAGFVPVMAFILFGLLQLIITGFNLKKINHIHNLVGKNTQILKKYGVLIQLIECQSFKTQYLNSLKNKLQAKEVEASKSLRKIQKLATALDNRLNILFALFSNAFFLWDLQLVKQIEIWKRKNQKELNDWFEVIYEFDSLSGFATFSFNHPEYCYPEFIEGHFHLEMKQAGHPLIESTARIDNDFNMKGTSQFGIITGANMAGKSTFLRAIGVNIIMANAGSKVCAKDFKMSQFELHTSIRNSDSVQKNESYFFAELKRLKVIIDRLKNNESVFVILDEILRGTNSKDKHFGSQALIEQLIRLNGNGLLATHDTALGLMVEKYPLNLMNFRFEVEIKNDELFFDYKIKPGISQNLNATFLMKKMGITM